MSRAARRLLLMSILVAAGTSSAAASDRPVVFLHGFAASAGDWTDAASRLQQSLALQARIPGLAWQNEFPAQAAALQANAQFGSLPNTTVAVGHSNGGLVAREWSKLHNLAGIVTIGTPHGGAPILQNLVQWAMFNDVTRWAIDRVLSAFAVPTDSSWVIGAVQQCLRFASDYSVFTVTRLFAGLGVQTTVPVSYQMMPGSSFLNALNSDGNLSREAASAPKRVGIASVAHNYYWAGPARAVLPQDADAIAVTLYASAGTLIGYGNALLGRAAPGDWASIEQALSLIGLGSQLLMIDQMYCALVSHPVIWVCMPNDGVVPIDRQAYPGAANLLIQGPAHTQEKQQSDDVLYHALVNYVGVPPRGSEPAPAPIPPPPPSPSPAPSPAPPPPDPDPGDAGGGDGGSGGSGGSGSNPGDPHEPVTIDSGELLPDQLLRPGDIVRSRGGRVFLAYQGDGNLVLYDDQGRPIWASHTDGQSTGVVAMQGDGNLVMYDADGVPRWASDTPGRPGAFLAVQDDGNVVIYADGQPVWATNTSIQ
ncbi:MAG: hypothetical protein IT184_14425 [Acidobacteria bacterium]|nr:hypothetical protein [Acidobacteriota bacterium]